jgi:hypothetical protein
LKKGWLSPERSQKADQSAGQFRFASVLLGRVIGSVWLTFDLVEQITHR